MGVDYTRTVTSDSFGRVVIDSLQQGTYTNVSVALSGCTSNSLSVTLSDPAPPVLPVLVSNSPVCSGALLILSGSTTTSGVTYLWSGPHGFTSTLQNPSSTVGYADSGWYHLTVSKLNCSTTDSTYVYTQSIPQAGPVTGSGLLCLYNSNLYSDTAIGTWRTITGNASISTSGLATGVVYGPDTILHITSNHCGSDTALFPLMVEKIPTIGTISGATRICVGVPVSFYDTTIGGIWSVSNTYAIISTSGVVTGMSPGFDTIYYSLTNVCGTGSASAITEVIALPDAGVISGTTVLCNGLVSHLSSTVAGGYWSSSNPSVASIDGLGNVFGISPGTVTITYTFVNYCGTAYSTATVNILPQPTAGITYGDSSLCIGETSWLLSNVGGVNWLSVSPSIVNIISASTSGDSAKILGISPGVTSVLHIITNSCGVDTAYYTVTVEEPVRLLSSHAPGTICSDKEFQYMPILTGSNPNLIWTRDTTTFITNYSGFGADSIREVLTSISTDPVEVWYHFTMVDKGCASYDSIKLIVNPTPHLSSIGHIRVCPGVPVNYQATSLTSGTSFTWVRVAVSGIMPDTASGFDYISEVLHNSLDTPITVYYNFHMNAAGCSNDETISVTVEQNEPSAPRIAIMPLSHTCINSRYQNFGAATPPPSGMTYYWYGRGGAEVWATGLTRQNCLVNFPEYGLSWVVLACTYEGNVCASRDSFQMFVGPHYSDSPKVTYSAPAFVCMSNDQDTYQWGYDDRATLDSTLLPFETNQAYINDNPDLSHKFYWVITTKDGCMQKSYLETPMAVLERDSEHLDVEIFPNPNEGRFNVKLTSTFYENAHVRIADAVGKLVQTCSIHTNADNPIDFDQQAGIYFITITTSHGVITRKIIVR